MRAYFHLQTKMTCRKMSALGLHPIVGIALFIPLFIGFSLYLFSTIDFAPYLYVILALSFVHRLSESQRNDFLAAIFPKKTYLLLRIIENNLVVSPFIIFLFYQQLMLPSLLLFGLTLLMALTNFRSRINFTIPTPFYKKPFEFLVGFRNTFYLFIFSYFITAMAVISGNFNLGCFALILVFLVSLFFYTKLENDYYIWIYRKRTNGFLFEKMKTALLHATLLSFPILLTLSFLFFNEIGTLLVLLVIGYLYLITIIVAKYAAYPYELSLPQGVIIGLSLLFPPLLTGIIPFFYWQSNQRLKKLLG